MIQIFLALLFSISANIDNIAIGLSYGIKKIHISYYQKLIISLVTSLVTLLSMIFGNILTNIINTNITSYIGAICLIIIGIYSYFKTNDLNEKNTISNYNNILLIILILSTNNIVTGILASSMGINILATFIFTIIFCYLFLNIGIKFGNSIKNRRIEVYSNALSSLILIFLGIIEILIK